MELKESEFNKPLNSHEDILKQTAKDLDIDISVVKFAIKDFWNNLSHIIRNPLEYKLGVGIDGFIKFTLNSLAINRIRKYYTKTPDIAEQIESHRKNYERSKEPNNK